jgi:small subunit ribosomal protein S16
MLAIRLMRTGKIHAPHYRIVVQEKRSKLNGKAIDIIGHYHPAQADKLLVINKEKANEWLKKGAQASDTVTNLFVKEGIFEKSKKISLHFEPKTKEATPAAAVAEEEATPEEVAEMTTDEPQAEEVAPTEEAPAEEPAAEAPEETETIAEEPTDAAA